MFQIPRESDGYIDIPLINMPQNIILVTEKMVDRTIGKPGRFTDVLYGSVLIPFFIEKDY